MDPASPYWLLYSLGALAVALVFAAAALNWMRGATSKDCRVCNSRVPLGTTQCVLCGERA